LTVLLLVAGTIACVQSPNTSPSGVDKPKASPTLAPSIHYEEGKLAFLGVNVHLAKFSLDKDLVPLEIAVVNKGLATLTIGPESFTLRSLDGQAWPMAPPQESAGSSLRSDFDRKTQPVSFTDVLSLRFSIYKYIPSTFSSRGGNPSMTRTAPLARTTYTAFQAWFPNPGGELKGQLFEVWLEAPELPEPIFTTIQF